MGLAGARGVLGQIVHENLRQIPSKEDNSYDGRILGQSAIEEWAGRFHPEMVFNLAAVVPVPVVGHNQSLPGKSMPKDRQSFSKGY